MTTVLVTISKPTADSTDSKHPLPAVSCEPVSDRRAAITRILTYLQDDSKSVAHFEIHRS